ncbi:MAG: hypothetical protein J2P36_05235 [Ktedonobacteraceae bacterium]|nr:hypothetical protein [Ktedonobacteraceae bacterium]
MQLPADLSAALEERLATQNVRSLASVSGELSQRYRSGHARSQQSSETFLHSQNDVLAYAAYRLPATFAAIYAALAEVQARRPGWQPRSLLDVGAGPGTAAWAAATIWPELEQATLLERDARMIALGKDLSGHAACSALRHARWLRAELAMSSGPENSRYDLVIMAYVLGEIPAMTQEELIERLWRQTADTLLIVEPGTPRGFALVRAARERLLAVNAQTLAPCPHNQPCPMSQNDWCHFAQRVSRTRLQRSVKGGTLSYEDEKFAYAAMSRADGLPIQARVIRHPQKRSGHVRLDLCTPTGLKQEVVARSAKERYHMAQDLEWGSTLNEPL